MSEAALAFWFCEVQPLRCADGCAMQPLRVFLMNDDKWRPSVATAARDARLRVMPSVLRPLASVFGTALLKIAPVH